MKKDSTTSFCVEEDCNNISGVVKGKYECNKELHFSIEVKIPCRY